MKVEQIAVPAPWGHIRGQIFGDRSAPNTRPILCLHGYLDNSNSFKPLARFLTRSNQFYLVAFDFPGHGLSSKLPDGIPYTPKLFVSAVRRAVRHLELTRFYLMGHSYGIGITILYQTLFKNEVLGTIALDWIFNHYEDRWKDMPELYRKGIEVFIDEFMAEKQDESKEKNTEQRELTRERAVNLLLKANPGLDTENAELLLERGLIRDENGKLNFSRDKKVKTSIFDSPDHYGDFVFLIPHINFAAPILTIHAAPPSYGDVKGANTLALIKRLRENSTALVESMFVEGSHHLHMTKARETSEIILNFLGKIKSIEPVVNASKL